MKPIIKIKDKIWFLSKGYLAITLFPYIFIRKVPFERLSDKKQKETITHENIHIKQQIELLIIFFYLIYIIEFIIKLFIYGSGSDAYRNISFEREAHSNDKDENYVKNRKFWGFIKYIF